MYTHTSIYNGCMFKPILFKFDKRSPLVRKSNQFCYTREFKNNWALPEGPAHIQYIILRYSPVGKGDPEISNKTWSCLSGTSFEPIH